VGRVDGRQGRLLAGLALAVALGAGGAHALGVGEVGPYATDAAWTRQEAGALDAGAGRVAPAVTTCTAPDSAPHRLTLAPADGLEVTGYRVTVTIDGAVPDGWQTGMSGDAPFMPANTTTDVDASTGTVSWGITGGWNTSYSGDATVQALGPGGWASDPVVYDWTISFNIVGYGYGTCDPA